MAKNKTVETKASVFDFIHAIEKEGKDLYNQTCPDEKFWNYSDPSKKLLNDQKLIFAKLCFLPVKKTQPKISDHPV